MALLAPAAALRLGSADVTTLVVSSYMPVRGSGRAARTYGIVRALGRRRTGRPAPHRLRRRAPPTPPTRRLDGAAPARRVELARRRGAAWRGRARGRAGRRRAVARGVSPGAGGRGRARWPTAAGRVIAEDPMAAVALRRARAAAAGDLQRPQPRVGLPARARPRLGLAPQPPGVRAAPARGRRGDLAAQPRRPRRRARARAGRRPCATCRTWSTWRRSTHGGRPPTRPRRCWSANFGYAPNREGLDFLRRGGHAARLGARSRSCG